MIIFGDVSPSRLHHPGRRLSHLITAAHPVHLTQRINPKNPISSHLSQVSRVIFLLAPATRPSPHPALTSPCLLSASSGPPPTPSHQGKPLHRASAVPVTPTVGMTALDDSPWHRSRNSLRPTSAVVSPVSPDARPVKLSPHPAVSDPHGHAPSATTQGGRP